MQQQNFVSNTLNGAIDASQLTLILNSAADFPNPSLGYYFLSLWDSGTYSTPAAAEAAGALEHVLVTSLSVNTLTIVRGMDGTSGIAHSDGDTVAMLQTKGNAESIFALNVRAFGATGDGTTDDSAAFTTALDAAMLHDLPVYVPPGVYSVTWGNKATTGPVVIYGDDRERSIIKGDGTNRFLNLDSSHRTEVFRLAFHDFDVVINGNGLDASEVQSRVVIENCRFNNVDQVFGAPSSAPSGAGVTYLRMADCVVLGGGVKAVIDTIQLVVEAHIINNLIESQAATTNSAVIKIGRDSGGSTEENNWLNCNVRGNIIRACSVAGTVGRAIELYGKGHCVADNQIESFSGGSSENVGIFLNARFSSVRGNAISLSSTGPVGIHLHGEHIESSGIGVGCFANVVSENTLDLGNTAASVGVRVEASQQIIRGNQIYQAATGVELLRSGGSDRLLGTLIDGNMLTARTTGTTYGVRWNGDHDLRFTTITGNHFGVEGQYFTSAIDIDGGALPRQVLKLAITNNHIPDAATNCIRLDTSGAGGLFLNVQILGNMITALQAGANGVVFEGTNACQKVDMWANAVDAPNKYVLTTRPEINRFFENIDDNSPNAVWTAGLAAIAISIEGTTGSFLRKATGDITNTGWVTP